MDNRELMPDVDEYLARVESEVLEPLKKSNVTSVRQRAAKVERELRTLRQETPADVVDRVGVASDEVQYLREGMRDQRGRHTAYTGATPEEANLIATGKTPARDTGKPLEPIKLTVETEPGSAPQVTLSDGRHRLVAARAAGADDILAEVRDFKKVDGDWIEGETVMQPVSVWGTEGRRRGFAELETTRRELRNAFQPPKPATGGLPPAVPEHAEALERAERILDTYLDETTQKALRKTGDDTQRYLTLQKQYSHLRDLEDITSNAARQQLGNRAISPSDYATGFGIGIGALLSGNVTGLAYGAASTVAHKLVRERGRSLLAGLADRASKLDLRMDDFAKRLAGIKKGGVSGVVKASTMAGDFDELSEAVQEADTNPRIMARVLEQSTAGMEMHTGLAGGIHQTIQGDIAYLREKLPTRMTRASSSLTPTVETVRVTTRDKKRWLERKEALANPVSVVERLAKGEVPVDAIDALRDRRPRIWEDLRNRVMVATAERDTPLPYRKRVTLGMVFAFPADASLRPAMMRSIQAIHGTSAEPKPPGPKPTSKLDADKLSTEMMTTTQRVAAGG